MLTRLFSLETIEKQIKNFNEEQNKKIALAMARVGAEVVNEAKDNANYTDDTSILRSSTGFRVYNGKKAIGELFEGKNSEGVEIGKMIASKLNDDTSPHLIITAGAEYAEDVEEREYTVITEFIEKTDIYGEILSYIK